MRFLLHFIKVSAYCLAAIIFIGLFIFLMGMAVDGHAWAGAALAAFVLMLISVITYEA